MRGGLAKWEQMYLIVSIWEVAPHVNVKCMSHFCLLYRGTISLQNLYFSGECLKHYKNLISHQRNLKHHNIARFVLQVTS